MIAEITKQGILNIIPTSSTEVYALENWKKSAYERFGLKDITTQEKGYWRGSKLIIESSFDQRKAIW